MTRVEGWLDEGMGSCRLSDAHARKLVVESMHHYDAQRYELDCYTVLPNHVHAILRPLIPAAHPLEKILQSWKLYTSRRINALFGVSGHFWQPESYDRIIRDEEHLYRAIQYIGKNAERAGLRPEDTVTWIRPEWRALGWDFEQTHGLGNPCYKR
jgi:REP element-mobilizing transposase RayT